MVVLYRAPPDRASDGRFGRVAGQHAGKQPASGNRPSYRDPGAVRRAWPKLKARFAAVKGRLLELAAKIDPADVLPTVDDYSRLTAARDLDPLRLAVGIPMYDAALVFSHAVAWAVTQAKKKLGGQSRSYAAEDVREQLLALFREFVGGTNGAGPEQSGYSLYHYDPATKTGVAWGKYYIRGHQVTEAEYKAFAAKNKPAKGGRVGRADRQRTGNRPAAGRSAKAHKPHEVLPDDWHAWVADLRTKTGVEWEDARSRARERIGRFLHARTRTAGDRRKLWHLINDYSGAERNPELREWAESAAEVLLQSHLAAYGYEYNPVELSDLERDGVRINAKLRSASGALTAKLGAGESRILAAEGPANPDTLHARLYLATGGRGPEERGVFLYAGLGQPALFHQKEGYGDGIGRPLRVMSMEEYERSIARSPEEIGQRINAAIDGLDRERYKKLMTTEDLKTKKKAVEITGQLIDGAVKAGGNEDDMLKSLAASLSPEQRQKLLKQIQDGPPK